MGDFAKTFEKVQLAVDCVLRGPAEDFVKQTFAVYFAKQRQRCSCSTLNEVR